MICTLIAANLIAWLIAEIAVGSTLDTSVLIKCGGALVSAVSAGEYWRLFTCMFMHSGIRHILNNMVMLYVLGTNLENLTGHVKCAVIYLGGGLISSIVSWQYYSRMQENTVFVGASGAIYAVMGAIIYIIIRNHGRAGQLTMRQMLVMLAFSLYYGFVAAGVSNIAHISGLIGGFILGVILYHPKKQRRQELY